MEPPEAERPEAEVPGEWAAAAEAPRHWWHTPVVVDCADRPATAAGILMAHWRSLARAAARSPMGDAIPSIPSSPRLAGVPHRNRCPGLDYCLPRKWLPQPN